MKIFLVISLIGNGVLLYYLIHDTKYYKEVITKLQAKYNSSLEKSII